jgi:hypothetical protein
LAHGIWKSQTAAPEIKQSVLRAKSKPALRAESKLRRAVRGIKLRAARGVKRAESK